MSPLSEIPTLVATVVDGEALFDTAVAALVAGIVVTFSASTAIYGLATSAERRRDGREAAAVGAAAVGILGVLLFAATIAVGLYVMING